MHSLNTVSHCCPPWQAQSCPGVPGEPCSLSLVTLQGRGAGHNGGTRREPHCSQPSWDVWTPVDSQCQRENSPLSRPRAWLIIRQDCSLPSPSTPGLPGPHPALSQGLWFLHARRQGPAHTHTDTHAHERARTTSRPDRKGNGTPGWWGLRGPQHLYISPHPPLQKEAGEERSQGKRILEGSPSQAGKSSTLLQGD